MTNNKLIGPRAHEREVKELQPEDVRLADGRPLYHALLENPDTPVLLPAEAQKAKQELSILIEDDKEKVLSCQGKTLTKAQNILRSVTKKQAI